AGMRVRRLHRPRGERIAPVRCDVVGVQRTTGHVSDRAFVRLADSDDRILRPLRQGAHAPTPIVAVDCSKNFSTACESMMLRYSALALWSLIGVPSRPSEAAATRAVPAVHGVPMRVASVSRARIGVAQTPPRPIRASRTT